MDSSNCAQTLQKIRHIRLQTIRRLTGFLKDLLPERGQADEGFRSPENCLGLSLACHIPCPA